MFSIVRLNGEELVTDSLEWIEDGIDENGDGCSRYVTSAGEDLWINDLEDFEVTVV